MLSGPRIKNSLRSMIPNETPQKYLFELKRLLNKAFPEMDGQAKEQLVFEQYIRSLPKVVYFSRDKDISGCVEKSSSTDPHAQ